MLYALSQSGQDMIKRSKHCGRSTSLERPHPQNLFPLSKTSRQYLIQATVTKRNIQNCRKLILLLTYYMTCITFLDHWQYTILLSMEHGMGMGHALACANRVPRGSLRCGVSVSIETATGKKSVAREIKSFLPWLQQLEGWRTMTHMTRRLCSEWSVAI